jgi:hypothetical protein
MHEGGGRRSAGLMKASGIGHTIGKNHAHFKSDEEARIMAKLNRNDSLEQRAQQAQNASGAAARETEAADAGIDKKLNGPNRPST